MNIGFFGGTFDPFHLGHEFVLKTAYDSKFFDVIYVVPSANPPHKPLTSVSLATYRYEMAKIGILSSNVGDIVKISDIEMNDLDKSFTLNTVKKIKKQFTDANIYIIGGADIPLTIQSWYKPKELLSEVNLFIIARPGFQDDEVKEFSKKLTEKYGTKVVFSDNKMLDISSSDIRSKFKNNDLNLSNYISPEIENFVKENKLYSDEYDLSALENETVELISVYERKLRESLTSNRLIHSLNTMREAVKLADIFGEDRDKAAIAGILHDCAKFQEANKVIEDLIREGVLTKKYLYEDKPAEIRHAYWGKIIANEIYKVNDKEILDAIYYHTTSKANPTGLSMLTFVADKIEPKRNFPRIEEIRNIAYSNLNYGHYECLKDIIKVLEKKGKQIHKDTTDAFNKKY